MPRGGPRAGAGSGGSRANAGRKKGAPNKAAAEREKAIRNSGLTPLDVMIEAMRYYYGLAGKHQAGGEQPDPEKFVKFLNEARTSAKDAAPYVHSRMSATEAATGGLRDLGKLTDKELDDLERISRKIAGAFGNTGRAG